MSAKYDFTICIPTYNSEKTLIYTLESIKNQAYDKTKIEVLVVDGGSTDSTIDIAKQYPFVRIIENSKKLPEYAKLIGLQNASGEYFIKMDSDEAFVKNSVLSTRKQAMDSYPNTMLLVADKLLYVKGYGTSGEYLNICGDPFTWFMYNSKNGVVESFSGNVKENKNGIMLFEFKPEDKKPIADSGTTVVRIKFVTDNFDVNDIKTITSMTDKILEKCPTCLCIEGDDVFHRSNATFKSYIKKIKFRIINNIFAKKDSGFSTRNISSNKKKFLFPLYTFSFILPLIDSIKLSIKHKTTPMMLHIIYCYYTTILIAYYMMLKMLGKSKTNEVY